MIDAERIYSDMPIDMFEAIKKGRARLPPMPNLAVRSTLPLVYKIRKSEVPRDKAKRVKRELLDAGATIYGLMKSESRYLPKVLHNNEHIEALIYGQHNASSAMLVATGERIIYLDKKPMVELFDEVSYEVVSGIEFDIHLFFATVILHTPVKNYDFKFVNMRCAERFARHIEKLRLELDHEDKEPVIEMPDQPTIGEPANGSVRELNNMAGYYWLPTDEEERGKIQQIRV